MNTFPMRLKNVLFFVGIIMSFSMTSANAMGYVAWQPSSPQTSDFSQNISIPYQTLNTAWKAQVRISKDVMFGIAFNSKQGDNSVAEFGAYYDSGVTTQSVNNNTCLPTAGSTQQFMLCTIPFKLSFPSKINLQMSLDNTDSSGSTWAGYITDLSTGTKHLIAKFNVGVANLNVIDILEYIYPYSINECSSTASRQSAVFWTPSSSQGIYRFQSLSNSQCGTVQYAIAANSGKTDGVQVTLTPESTSLLQYQNSINEILFPEVWQQAYALGSSQMADSDSQKYNQLLATSNTQVAELQASLSTLTSALTALQSALDKINIQFRELKNQTTTSQAKLTKICSVKPKPKGC